MSYLTRSELAMAYFPDSPVDVAVKSLRYEIEHTPGLLEELRRNGYKKRTKRLSPHLICIIEKHLGEP